MSAVEQIAAKLRIHMAVLPVTAVASLESAVTFLVELKDSFATSKKGRLMDQPDQLVRKPSVFVYSLVGCLIADAVGIPALVAMSISAGDFNEVGTLQFLVGTGALGATIGFEIAARRLKAFGGGGM